MEESESVEGSPLKLSDHGESWALVGLLWINGTHSQTVVAKKEAVVWLAISDVLAYDVCSGLLPGAHGEAASRSRGMR